MIGGFLLSFLSSADYFLPVVQFSCKREAVSSYLPTLNSGLFCPSLGPFRLQVGKYRAKGACSSCGMLLLV